MWLLGDDDPPFSNAVATIWNEINSYADYGFINFKSHMSAQRSVPITACGPEEFISKIDDFGNLLMISLGLYNVQLLQGDLRLGYQLSYCLAPHLVYLLSGVREGVKVLFADVPLINFSLHTGNAAGDTWSWISLSMCIPLVYEVPLPISATAKKKLAEFWSNLRMQFFLFMISVFCYVRFFFVRCYLTLSR
jgi:hypothetical protein